MEEKINHIIITRCRFQTEDLFQKYFTVMKKTYIPSINSQTDKNFSIALIVNPKHFELIRKEINEDITIIPFTFTDQQKKYDEFKKYIIKNNITLQTRHDCDDIMNSTYIETIHKLYNENKIKYDDFILNFQPTKVLIDSGKEYTHSRDYSRTCSMFTTLIQKKVKHGIMDCMHDHLTRLTKNVIYIPENYVKLVIHGNNTLSKIKDTDKFIRNL